MDWADVLSLVNVILAGIGAAMSFVYVARNPKPFSWLKMFYGLIGAYWCALYVYVFWTGVYSIPRVFGPAFSEVFVRPAFTLTLAAMASGALWRIRSGRP